MWITVAFPVWVLVVSLLALVRAGVIDLHFTTTTRPAIRPRPEKRGAIFLTRVN